LLLKYEKKRIEEANKVWVLTRMPRQSSTVATIQAANVASHSREVVARPLVPGAATAAAGGRVA